MKQETKINFIISNWGNAHQLNKVLSFEKIGFTTKLYVYFRKIYPSGVDKEIEVIGKMEPGFYHKRLFGYFKSFGKIFNLTKKGELYFVFGFDNLLMLRIASILKFTPIKIIYEVADIRNFQLKAGLPGYLIALVEKFLFRKLNLLIVTSPEFVNEYYQKLRNFKLNAYEVIENKIHTHIQADTISRGLTHSKIERKGKLIIGFFGMMRCPRTLEILMKLVEDDDRFRVIIRGVFMNNSSVFKAKIEANPKIELFGPYVSPIDLEKMYEEIDIAWIAYPYSSKKTGNWEWARTNRYYEAGYNKTPMIASRDTVDGNNVKLHDLGLSVDMSSVESALKPLKEISFEQLDRWQENINKLPPENFEITNEYEELKVKMHNLHII